MLFNTWILFGKVLLQFQTFHALHYPLGPPPPAKYDVRFNSGHGQNWLKNNQYYLIIYIHGTLCSFNEDTCCLRGMKEQNKIECRIEWKPIDWLAAVNRSVKSTDGLILVKLWRKTKHFVFPFIFPQIFWRCRKLKKVGKHCFRRRRYILKGRSLQTNMHKWFFASFEFVTIWNSYLDLLHMIRNMF